MRKVMALFQSRGCDKILAIMKVCSLQLQKPKFHYVSVNYKLVWGYMASKVPSGVFLQTNKVLFTFSITHQDTLCVTLRPDKHVECIFSPHEHFESKFENVLNPASFTSLLTR